MAAGSSTSGRSPRRQAIVGLFVLLFVVLAPIALSGYLCPAPSPATAPVHVKILAVNDFHGQLPVGQNLNEEPAGSAPVLASYLECGMADAGEATTFIALSGDVVGASPPESGLLLDEPTLLFFNGLADDCPEMIATFGNHEFDRGTDELLRMVRGGNGTTTITPPDRPLPGCGSGIRLFERGLEDKRHPSCRPLHDTRRRRRTDSVYRCRYNRNALDPEGDQHRAGRIQKRDRVDQPLRPGDPAAGGACDRRPPPRGGLAGPLRRSDPGRGQRDGQGRRDRRRP